MKEPAGHESVTEGFFPCLVLTSGPLAGTRYLLREEVTRVGRAADNDIVIAGADAAVVSARHLEIRRENGSYRLYDLQSTNGTFVNGRRVSETTLRAPCSIQLGNTGPELAFVLDEEPEPDLNRTLAAAPVTDTLRALAPGAGIAGHDEQLLAEAVSRARAARRTGANQTLTIMREVLDTALRRTGKRLKRTIAALAVVLVAVTGFGAWKIHELNIAKAAIDTRIRQLEAQLNQAGANPAEADRILSTLDQYETEGRALEQNVFYRWGVRTREDFVTHEIRTLLAEFGAEVYSVPPEFVAEVNRYLRQYQGPDRPNMTRALGQARPVIQRVRRILEANHLPPDLAYMVLVESAMEGDRESQMGAAGLWQFTPATARQFGLRVGDGVDERLNVAKATEAACKYIRDLILDFGAGSSVMLALAAYNVGPAKVKQAIRRVVADPIKQRGFWYLYRRRALPAETREYVPKVIAAMIIGRQPQRFGF